MAFKPRGSRKNPTDLMALLVNSKIQTENNALYQTLYGLITILQQTQADLTTGKADLQKEIDAIESGGTEEIPAFFFMGSS